MFNAKAQGRAKGVSVFASWRLCGFALKVAAKVWMADFVGNGGWSGGVTGG